MAWGIHVTDSKVLGDLLHILKVEECIETGLMVEANIMVGQYNWSVSLWQASDSDMDHTMSCFYVMFLTVKVLEVSSTILVIEKRLDLRELHILKFIHEAGYEWR